MFEIEKPESEKMLELKFSILYSIEMETIARDISKQLYPEHVALLDQPEVYTEFLSRLDKMTFDHAHAEFMAIQEMDSPEHMFTLEIKNKAYLNACNRLGLTPHPEYFKAIEAATLVAKVSKSPFQRKR